MDNVLSQNEVNALLNAVRQGSVDTEPSADGAGGEQRSYDLTSNDRIVRGRMPTLDILNQRLARLLRQSFFNMFRKNVEVTHDSTNLMKYSEFIDSISVPACLNMFRLPPLRNTCLLSVDAPLMFGLVDHVFGGKGSWYRVEGREYSTIELKLIEQVVSMVLLDIESAWEPVMAVKPEYLRTEVNPQFAAIAAPTDVVLDVVFTVEIEGSTRGSINLLIPYSVIEPIRKVLSSALQTERNAEDNGWRRTIVNVLVSLDVELRVLLGVGHLKLQDLMDLRVGDTIQLNADPNQPLPCLIEGIEKADGWPVMSRGRVAVELADRVKYIARKRTALLMEGPDK